MKKNKNMTRKIKNKTRNRNRKFKNKSMIIKGGNNPFSGIGGLFGTMTYNLSNAMAVFTIAPPSSPLTPSIIDPSPGKQY